LRNLWRELATSKQVQGILDPGEGGRPSARGMIALGLSLGLIATLGVIATGPIAGLVLIAGILALVGVIYRPGVLFAAYLLIPFYKGALQVYSPVDITVLLALLNAVQIVPVFADRRRRNVSRAGILLWLALGLLVLGGVIYAPDQNLGLSRAVTFWALVLLPILPAAFRVGSDPRHVRDLLWTFFGMGAVTVVLGLTQLSSNQRLEVLGANTILVGRAALLVPLVGIAFVMRERAILVRAVTIILIPAAVIVALASGSRGPLFVLAAVGGLGAIRTLARPGQLNWRLAGGVAGLALASAVVVTLAAPNLPLLSIERFAQFGDFIQGGLSGDSSASAVETSSAERVRLFGLAVSLFEERPIFGVGTAGFEVFSVRLLGPLYGLAYPHNAVLQFAAEFGLVGVVVLASLVLLAMTRRLPPWSYGRAVRLLFLFFILNAMVSGDIFSDRTTWGLLMVVLLVDTSRAPEQWGSTATVPALDTSGQAVPQRLGVRNADLRSPHPPCRRAPFADWTW
jgi:O-antigen ligase